MIRKIIGGLGGFFVYFCVATIISQVFLFGYLAFAWKLDGDKAVQMLAIAQGVDLFEMRDAALEEREEVSQEQVSYDEILEARAIKVHHLQLREQALADGLELLNVKQKQLIEQLTEDRARFDRVQAGFEAKLAEMQTGAIAEGMDNIATTMATLKPAQAKQLLLDMIAKGEMDTVVALLADMPTSKSAKIMGEFKTPEENETLCEILRRIRLGGSVAGLIKETEEELTKPETKQL